MQSLQLTANRLTVIYSDMKRNMMLHALEIGINELTAIPQGMKLRSDLQSLGLNNNQLTVVPAEITQLTACFLHDSAKYKIPQRAMAMHGGDVISTFSFSLGCNAKGCAGRALGRGESPLGHRILRRWGGAGSRVARRGVAATDNTREWGALPSIAPTGGLATGGAMID